MSFTAGEVANLARSVITNANYQVGIYNWMTAGLHIIEALREDCMLDSFGNRVTLPTVTSDADIIPLNNKFVTCLADYCIGRGFQEDGDSQKHRERGTEHIKMFYDTVKGL